VRTNRWPFWTAWGLAIGLMLVLACVEKARRVYPMNMLLLGAFTVAQAFLVGMISAYYNIEVRMYMYAAVRLLAQLGSCARTSIALQLQVLLCVHVSTSGT
jgi:hypothetical protein